MSRATIIIASEHDRRAEKSCSYCGNSFQKDKRYSRKYWERQKFCSIICSGKAASISHRNERKSIEEYFWRFVSKGNDNECWLWAGAKDKNGYGAYTYTSHDGKKHSYRAHRLSLSLSGVDVPKGVYVCHRCDNPACCNPRHLYVGTPIENSADAVSRNRVRRGSRCTGAKLTESEVAEIRSSVGTHAEIAKRFGVCGTTVTFIKNRVTWRHVP